MSFRSNDRLLASRLGTVAATALVVGLGLATTSCGGGGEGFAAKQMVLLQAVFVNRELVPTAPTGTRDLPRNALIEFRFSELVNPLSVDDQTIQIRFGPQLQSVPTGSFQVSGNVVRFDPTVTAQGIPNPAGFEPVKQYIVEVPNFEEQDSVVENLDDDPLLTSFFTSFVTSTAYLHEVTPPEVVRVDFQPLPNPLTGEIPGNGSMIFVFSEAMEPGAFLLGQNFGGEAPIECPETYTIDIRFDDDADINRLNGRAVDQSAFDCNGLSPGGKILPEPTDPTTPVARVYVGQPIEGYFTHNAAMTEFAFHPAFSFGNKKYVVVAEVKQGLKDLAGNLLINPRSFGPYVCDGKGRNFGQTLAEDFTNTINMDANATTADWGSTEVHALKGQPVTSRQARIFTRNFVAAPNYGQYGAIPDPLTGAALNQYVSGINPPTSSGRRVMWAFREAEIGAEGTITGAGWGPDSNATFAATYPNVILRMGYQKTSSISLSPSFSGNYEGSPTIVYQGTYQVAQAMNVGDTIPDGTEPMHPIGFNCNVPSLQPLFDNSGFAAWPTFNNYFDWDGGDPADPDDRVLLFDASVKEGDTWQQLRGWFAVTYPCSGVLIGGFPNRRMYATYEEDQPNPATSFTAGILNPEPSCTDSSFTVTKVISLGQTLFYTDGFQIQNSARTTFGARSNYLTPLVTPSVQAGGTSIVLEFNACDGIILNRFTLDPTKPYLADATGAPKWTQNQNECDGYKCIRWRLKLISNLINNLVARVTDVKIPILDDF